MANLRILLVLIIIMLSGSTHAAPDSTRVIQSASDSIARRDVPWYRQLMANGFKIHDPEIDYPRFPRFCLKVYDWGDKTFNSYDTTYVEGTGKNWKVHSKSYNWMESYMLMFAPRSRDMIHIRSSIYDDLGAYISFMAGSVGYTAKVNNWFSNSNKQRKNLDFNFTCSRFSAQLDYTVNEGDAYITHFGDYDKVKHHSMPFNDIKHKSLTGNVVYFFNYRKYSQAAAYSFSKYQLKSAGTAFAGFSFNYQMIDLDFTSLPDEMKLYLPLLSDKYHFRYADYGLMGGYAHNWAIVPRKWLVNITVGQSIGYRHSYSMSTEGRKKMLATNFLGRFSVVYNHRAMFASLNGRIDGSLYLNSKYAFFNTIESLSLIVGARF